MDSEREAQSEKTLQTAAQAVQRMRSRLAGKTQHKGKTPFDAESYMWKKFISLDGEHQLYTTVVLICMALALLILFFERGILRDRDNEEYLNLEHLGIAGTRILRSLLLILSAVLDGLLAFFLLGLNLRDLKTMPESVSVRWLFLSAFGFAAANLAALSVAQSAQEAYEWRRDQDSYEKPVPHYMILGVFGFFMLCMDILYVRNIYLPFFEAKAKGWEFVRRNIPAIIELGHQQNGQISFLEKMSYPVTVLLNRTVKFINVLLYNIFHACDHVFQWWMNIYADEDSFVLFKSLSRGISDLMLLPIRFLRWSPLIQVPCCLIRSSYHYSIKSLTYVFAPLIRFARVSRVEGKKRSASWRYRLFRGVLHLLEKSISNFSSFKPEVQRAARELWEDIKEDEEYKHSSWLKAAVITASILLLYFGLKLVYHFQGYIDDVYIPTRNCIINNPGVTNFFLRFTGFSPSNSTSDDPPRDPYAEVCAAGNLTTLVNTEETQGTQDQAQQQIGNLTQDQDPAFLQNPYLIFGQRLEARVNQDLEEDKLYKCAQEERQENVCVFLSAINLAEEMLSVDQSEDPSDKFLGSFTGEVVYVFDVYMRNLDWAVWIGFLVGCLFGFWTLLSVMAQYKKLSLAIRSGLFQDLEIEKQGQIGSNSQKMGFLQRVDSIIDTHLFANLISKYPMSVSIFFSGMLISTAILQLVVFGTLVASIVSLLASLSDDEVFSIVSPILWTLLAFMVTWLFNGPIATMILGEGLLVSHFQVIYEICFFLFLLVFTSIHLVIGIFLAFFRMLWVLLTALITINRLDKNLFTICRERDLGHKSFMALVFMSHVFHVNRTGSENQRSAWESILQQLENSPTRDSVKNNPRPTTSGTSNPVRHQSQPLTTLMKEEGIFDEQYVQLERGNFSRRRHVLPHSHTSIPYRSSLQQNEDNDTPSHSHFLNL